MRTFFQNIISSLIAGIVFSVTVIFFLFLYDHFVTQKEPEEESGKYIKNSKDIKISETRFIEGTSNITLFGVAANKSDKKIHTLQIHADIYLNDNKLNECSQYIHHLKQDQKRAFLVICKKTSTKTSIQDSFTYDIRTAYWEN